MRLAAGISNTEQVASQLKDEISEKDWDKLNQRLPVYIGNHLTLRKAGKGLLIECDDGLTMSVPPPLLLVLAAIALRDQGA